MFAALSFTVEVSIMLNLSDVAAGELVSGPVEQPEVDRQVVRSPEGYKLSFNGIERWLAALNRFAFNEDNRADS